MQRSLPALHRPRIEAHRSGDLFLKLTDNFDAAFDMHEPKVCAKTSAGLFAGVFTLSPSVSLGKRSRRARGNSKRCEQERAKC
jgi:hypothetical protein